MRASDTDLPVRQDKEISRVRNLEISRLCTLEIFWELEMKRAFIFILNTKLKKTKLKTSPCPFKPEFISVLPKFYPDW